MDDNTQQPGQQAPAGDQGGQPAWTPPAEPQAPAVDPNAPAAPAPEAPVVPPAPEPAAPEAPAPGAPVPPVGEPGQNGGQPTGTL